jgi:NTE family protein
MRRRALVLGAGGYAAIAWEVGLLVGMADVGVDVRDADVIVGTSAGSLVGAQIASDLTLRELFHRQADPQLQTKESQPAVDFMRWRMHFMRAKEGPRDAIAVLKRFGTLALQTPADTQEVRRNTIAAQLPTHTWPERRLLIVAVDVDSGERHVFDRSSGIDLIDAVTASRAVPGIWPAVAFGGRRYMDGGVYSIDNADLALGCDHVLIATLAARVPPLCVASLDTAVDILRRGGTRVDVIQPDEASQMAFTSTDGNLLARPVREAAARAGREQGQRVGRNTRWDRS